MHASIWVTNGISDSHFFIGILLGADECTYHHLFYKHVSQASCMCVPRRQSGTCKGTATRGSAGGQTTTGQGRAFGCRAGVERGIHNDAKGVAAGATFHSCVNLCVYICRHASKGGKARRAPVCAQRVFGLTPGCFCRSATCLSVCRSASVKDASKVLVLRTGLGSLSTVICLVPNDYGASGGIEVCRLLLPVFGCSP